MSVTRAGAAAAAVALSGMAVFGLQAPAFANHECGHYPAAACVVVSLQISDTTPVPGTEVEISAGGFKPGSRVTLTITTNGVTTVLGTFTADKNGFIRGKVRIPANLRVGRHTLTVTGVDSKGAVLRSSRGFTITAANAALARGEGPGQGNGNGNGGIPRTGTEIALATATGLALVGVGAVVVYGVRRRSTAAA